MTVPPGPAQVHVALLRGINVGRAKRVGMADLRRAFERGGYADVVTVLNSGNVVFRPTVGSPADPAEAYLPERFVVGVDAIYVWIPDGVSNSTIPVDRWTKRLGVVGTSRNWRTVLRLAELTRG